MLIILSKWKLHFPASIFFFSSHSRFTICYSLFFLHLQQPRLVNNPGWKEDYSIIQVRIVENSGETDLIKEILIYGDLS